MTEVTTQDEMPEFPLSEFMRASNGSQTPELDGTLFKWIKGTFYIESSPEIIDAFKTTIYEYYRLFTEGGIIEQYWGVVRYGFFDGYLEVIREQQLILEVLKSFSARLSLALFFDHSYGGGMIKDLLLQEKIITASASELNSFVGSYRLLSTFPYTLVSSGSLPFLKFDLDHQRLRYNDHQIEKSWDTQIYGDPRLQSILNIARRHFSYAKAPEPFNNPVFVFYYVLPLVQSIKRD